MDVAQSHLAGGGYLGVSLEEVAKDVGVSKPALYYHFPGGKEELFVEIVHRSLRHIREGLERAMAGPEDGAGKLREAARWLMAGEDWVEHMAELRDVAELCHPGAPDRAGRGFRTAPSTPRYAVRSPPRQSPASSAR